jgi:hypothetical protein
MDEVIGPRLVDDALDQRNLLSKHTSDVGR